MNTQTPTIFILPTDTCFGIACALDDKKGYHKIYDIKKRSFDKPLAVLVESFDWLEKYTSLTPDQIDFLKVYEKPFTVVTDCPNIQIFLNFEDDEDGEFRNNKVYKKIGFRVANMGVQKKLLKEHGPLWMTSANLSGEGEIYRVKEITAQFEYYIERDIVKVVGKENLDSDIKPSDVFEFVGESLELSYIRKN